MANPVQVRNVEGSGTSLALAYLTNNIAAGMLAACVGNADSGDVLTSVTSTNGNTWQQATSVVGGGVHTAIWYAMNCAAGACTVTANFSASEFATSITIYELENMALSSTLDQASTGSGFSASLATGNITTTVADTFWIGIGCSTTGGATYTADASFIERVDSAGNRPVQVQDRIVSTTLTDNSTQTKTGGNANWSSCLAAFKMAAAAAAAARPNRQILQAVHRSHYF